jgi:hypothetical protein
MRFTLAMLMALVALPTAHAEEPLKPRNGFVLWIFCAPSSVEPLVCTQYLLGLFDALTTEGGKLSGEICVPPNVAPEHLRQMVFVKLDTEETYCEPRPWTS